MFPSTSTTLSRFKKEVCPIEIGHSYQSYDYQNIEPRFMLSPISPSNVAYIILGGFSLIFPSNVVNMYFNAAEIGPLNVFTFFGQNIEVRST